MISARGEVGADQTGRWRHYIMRRAETDISLFLVKRYLRQGLSGHKRSPQQYAALLAELRAGASYRQMANKLGISYELVRILHRRARAAEIAGVLSDTNIKTEPN